MKIKTNELTGTTLATPAQEGWCKDCNPDNCSGCGAAMKKEFDEDYYIQTLNSLIKKYYIPDCSLEFIEDVVRNFDIEPLHQRYKLTEPENLDAYIMGALLMDVLRKHAIKCAEEYIK